MREAGIEPALLAVEDRPTTCKLRLVGAAQHRHAQQLMRLDYENPQPISPQIAAALLKTVEESLDGCQIVCVEDYNKGVISQTVCRGVIAMARARNIPVVIDPATIDDYSKYKGATALKLNRTEAARACGRRVDNSDDFKAAAQEMLRQLDLEAVVITLDRQGAYVASRQHEGRWLNHARPRQVFDATGAGDMVLAMLAVARAAGANWVESVALGNVAAGLEVERFGTVPIKPQEIVAELQAEAHEHPDKERSLPELMSELDRLRASGKRIVFTNGCFDLIHLGHVKYFQFARRQGDVLVVGVNTDSSIRRLKGDTRPILGEADRLGVLEELESIDYLIRFDQDTPIRLIEQIRPEVLVKGSDYAKEEVVGWDLVEGWGGRVVLAPLVDGKSTTAVIQRILEAHGQEPAASKPKHKPKSAGK
jgi:D-beta-D-heptose 7-phosphate kinase/D-beta-D-heptose 1-phosphate adenosyltransferase